MAHLTNNLNQPVGAGVPDWKPARLPAREALAGSFCRLEPLDAQRHSDSLHRAQALDGEGRNWTYLAYGPFPSKESYVEWIDQRSRSLDPLFYAVIDHERNEAVGVTSYLRIDPASGSIEVGQINYSPLLQRTPAATEAMYLMMQYAFGLGYRRYEWKCDALNAPSRAAASRLGFSFEGIFRQATVVKGRNRDTAWYAVIDREWPARQAAFRQWLEPSNFDSQGKQRRSLSALHGMMAQ